MQGSCDLDGVCPRWNRHKDVNSNISREYYIESEKYLTSMLDGSMRAQPHVSTGKSNVAANFYVAAVDNHLATMLEGGVKEVC